MIRKGYSDGSFGQAHWRMMEADGERTQPDPYCLHPALSSGLAFTSIMPHLAKNRRVIAPDYPGHGGSDPFKPEPTIAAPMTERHKIVAWGERWKRQLETGEIEQMRDMYEPDAVLMANGVPPQKGIDAIIAFLGRNKAAGNKVTIDFANEEIVIDGNCAYLTAKYWMTITLAKGNAINVMGRSFLVFKKNDDGAWRLWRDIDNQDPDVLAKDRPN